MSTPRILILGATSAIAQAYARRRAAEGAAFVLVARREDRLAAIAADLQVCGAAAAESVVLDLGALDRIQDSAHMLWARFSDVEEVLIAHGALGDQARAEHDVAAARAVIDTNFTSVALWLLALIGARPAAAPLTIVGIGSVAGDRGRASNFVYGSAKGGIERFLEGLAQKYDGSEVRIVTVKPGLVDTPMTAGMEKGGFLWASPETIAADIHRAVLRGRRVVYTPWFWWPIMTIIRLLPWFVFKRLKI
jgi:decaprenylphospho-beta-D-erythro-pentofuranosid-2-ulose 2-reductase